ncbi:MAG: sigma-70 family RNA polymerase sigma factor [Planctomycetota bacterium]
MNDGHFVRLLAKHEPEIRAYIRASLPSSQDVAEVMQNVSLVAWNKFNLLENAEADFAKWVCVIARFEIMKFRRGLARDRFVLDDDLVQKLCEEGEQEIDQRAEEIRHLEHCLEKLPEDRREIVIDAYRPGASIKELARGRGKKPDALYQLLRRIRQQLEACIHRQLELLGKMNA